MAAKYYDLSVVNLQAVGATCTSFNIEWEGLDCINQTCEVGSDNVLHIQVPVDCEFNCATALITCLDDCTHCKPLRVEICPCETSADCDLCSTCVNNYCVSVCTVDQECVNGECVDCILDAECEGEGKICVAGRCVCPDGYVEDKYGDCVLCTPETTPNCYTCDPDLGWIPVDCGHQVCDPETGDCVDCIASGDCPSGECCEDNVCVCCDDQVRNGDGVCVDPPCTSDDDCPEGYECVDGVCTPIDCGEGFVLIGNDCVPLCNCFDPECSAGFVCMNLDFIIANYPQALPTYTNPIVHDPDTCICIDESFLDPTGCGDIDCEGTADCPEGCGCVQEKCIPCEQIDCTTDPELCLSMYPNCECAGLDCSDVSNPQCLDTGALTLVNTGCDLKGEYSLSNNHECPCHQVSLLFTHSRNQIVDNVSYLTFPFDLEIKKGAGNSVNEVKALFNLSEQDEDGIADNHEPSSGTLQIEYTVSGKLYDPITEKVSNTEAPISTVTSTVNFAGSGIKSFIAADEEIKLYRALAFNNDPTNLVTIGLNQYEITKTVVNITQNGQIILPNGCKYDTSVFNVASFVFDQTQYSNYQSSRVIGNYEGYLNRSSDETSLPLFTWYRKDPNEVSFTDIFRQHYVSKVGSKYTDILYGPGEIPADGDLLAAPSLGELWPTWGYGLEVNCSCEDRFLSAVASFCNPASINNATFTNCNTTIQVDTFTTCDINTLLSEFNDALTGYAPPSSAQVYFDLVINGVTEKSYTTVDGIDFRSPENLDLFRVIDNGAVITEAKIVMRTLATVICEHDFVINSSENMDGMVATTNCVGGSDLYTITINETNNPIVDPIISIVPVSGTNVVSIGLAAGVWTVVQTKGVKAELVVTWNNGCSFEYEYLETCCDLDVVLTSPAEPISVDPGNTVSVQFDVTGNNGDVTFDLSLNGSQVDYQSGASTQFITTQLGYSIYPYILTVADQGEDCDSIEYQFYIGENTVEEITVECPGITYCVGDTGSISVHSNIITTLDYTLTPVVGPSTLHTLNFTSPGQTLYIDIDTTVAGTSNYNFDFPGIADCNITVEGGVIPTIVFDSNPDCSGTTVGFTITGEPNSTATFPEYPSPLTLSSGGTKTITGWLHGLTATTHSIVVTTTSQNGCVSVGLPVDLEINDSNIVGSPDNLVVTPSSPQTPPGDPITSVLWTPSLGVEADYSYAWTDTNGVNYGAYSASQECIVNVQAAGVPPNSLPVTVYLTVTSTNPASPHYGCSKDYQTTIDVTTPTIVEIQEVGPPIVTITDDPYIISIEEDTLVQASIGSGVTYAWTELSGPPGGSLIPGATTTQIVTLRPDVSGAYQLELEITNTVTGEVSTDTINVLAQVLCDNPELIDTDNSNCENTRTWISEAGYAMSTVQDTSEVHVEVNTTGIDCNGATAPAAIDILQASDIELVMIDGQILHGNQLTSVTLHEYDPGGGPSWTARTILTDELNMSTPGCGGTLVPGDLILDTTSQATIDAYCAALIKQIKNYAEATWGYTCGQILVNECKIDSSSRIHLKGDISHDSTTVILGINTSAIGGTESSISGGPPASTLFYIAGTSGGNEFGASYSPWLNPDFIDTSECSTNMTFGVDWDPNYWDFFINWLGLYSMEWLGLNATTSAGALQSTDGTWQSTVQCPTTTYSIDATDGGIDPCLEDPLATYQWQYNDDAAGDADGLVGFQDLVGETGLSYTVPYGIAMTYTYRVIATCPNGCVYYIEP